MTVATRILVVAAFAAVFGACSGSDCGSHPVEFLDSGYPPGSTGLNVQFAIDPNVAKKLDDPSRGPFVGQVFHSEDVNSLGPTNGAVPLGDITVDDLDLPDDGSTTEVEFHISPVPALPVTILGFVDTDGNRNEDDPQPDRGDPVTLPGDNEFQLVADHQNLVTVFFGLLNPL